MDLKEIFRHDGKKLYPEFAATGKRYRALRDLFSEFVGNFPPASGQPDKAVPPEELTLVEFAANANAPLLTAKWCDKEWRFRFDMVERQGRVRCLLAVPYEGSEDETDWKELGIFTFNGEGVTNITPPGGADPIRLQDASAAYGIVTSFLLAAFSSP